MTRQADPQAMSSPRMAYAADEPNDVGGSFCVRQSGNIGQEILDADGRIVAWTTDPWVAQVIVKLLNGVEGLLG